MPAPCDVTGRRYGKLVALYRLPQKGSVWQMKCDCGTEKAIRYASFSKGITRSCGCLRSEMARARNFVDIEGQRFGRLLVVSLAGNRGRLAAWNCICDCGALVVVAGSRMRLGETRSCGCYMREKATSDSTTHGGSKRPEYNVWRGAWQRTMNPRCKVWSSYGGRGIVMCERWRDSFANFLADVGPRPSPKHSLDRIDPNGNYEPGNVRWATAAEQCNNRRLSIRRVAEVLQAFSERDPDLIAELRKELLGNV